MLTHEEICWFCLELAFSVQIGLSVRCPTPCVKHMRSSQEVKGAMPMPPQFLAYLIVLCFETRCPKPSAVARLNSKCLDPPKFWLAMLLL